MTKMSRLAIDTGTPRSVQGHIVSGALASLVVAGAVNYNKYKKDEITKCEAVRDSLKLTLQGAVATSSAIAAANYIGEGAVLKTLSAVSVGFAGVYAVEKLSEFLEKRATCSSGECSLLEAKGE